MLFIDAVTLSTVKTVTETTVKTVTEMKRMIGPGEKMMCAQ